MERPHRVLVGLSGSVATVKWAELVLLLRDFCEVKVIATKAAQHFIGLSKGYNEAAWDSLHALQPSVEVLCDENEWQSYSRVKEDPVLHIELRKWADLLIVAPLSANTLAKLACGLCDNLLTCVGRAWDFKDNNKPFLVAPAMNTAMWEHPLTEQQLGVLHGWGIRVISPVIKTLACGDTGSGALAPVADIVAAVKEALVERYGPAPPMKSSLTTGGGGGIVPAATVSTSSSLGGEEAEAAISFVARGCVASLEQAAQAAGGEMEAALSEDDGTTLGIAHDVTSRAYLDRRIAMSRKLFCALLTNNHHKFTF